MGNTELAEKAKELVERRRKVICAGLELLIKTDGNYSQEDKKIANGFADESRRIALEREIILKQAWDKLDTLAIKILEVEYMDAINEEVEKVRQKINEIFRKDEDNDKE